jgi:hypothetical protein
METARQSCLLLEPAGFSAWPDLVLCIAKAIDSSGVETYGHDGTELAVVFDSAGVVSQRYLYGGAINEILADQTSLAKIRGLIGLLAMLQQSVRPTLTMNLVA